MPTDQERAEIIAKLLKLLDEMDGDQFIIHWKISIAKDLVRQLAEPAKPDGDGGA